MKGRERMHDVLKRLKRSGIVPVVVIDDAQHAVPTAKALLAGGVDVMEITFRTPAAADAIRAVANACPDMLVGAGTVITLDQCKTAVDAGAQFIVSPGFDPEVAAWCVDNSISLTPGCVTPTEITAAMKLGIHVLKFFPAGVYGGLNAMKNLAGPFGNVRFIPTGGVNAKNIGEYMAAPFIHAVGGSWVCPKAEIAAGHFEAITQLCLEARAALLGFELAHIGINTADADASLSVCQQLENVFGFSTKLGNSSNFASSSIEVMKTPYLGKNGHIAVRTNDIECAIATLEKKGFAIEPETAKYKAGALVAIYLRGEIGGFAIHLLQK